MPSHSSNHHLGFEEHSALNRVPFSDHLRGHKHCLDLFTANAASWNKNAYHQTWCYTHWQPLLKKSFTYLIKILPLAPTALQDSVQDQWVTVLFSASSSLGPSMAVSIFHQCLARSWPFAGTGCFVCILQLAACCRRLGASERNWFIAAVKKRVEDANEQRESSTAAGNWCRQWITTDLVWRHPPWPGSSHHWYVLTSHLISWRQRYRDGVRERLLEAFY